MAALAWAETSCRGTRHRSCRRLTRWRGQAAAGNGTEEGAAEGDAAGPCRRLTRRRGAGWSCRRLAAAAGPANIGQQRWNELFGNRHRSCRRLARRCGAGQVGASGAGTRIPGSHSGNCWRLAVAGGRPRQAISMERTARKSPPELPAAEAGGGRRRWWRTSSRSQCFSAC